MVMNNYCQLHAFLNVRTNHVINRCQIEHGNRVSLSGMDRLSKFASCAIAAID